MDNTDSAIFVIFDKDASSLFDLTCADMVHAIQTVCVVQPSLILAITFINYTLTVLF
jgi:hypothetical protein